MARRLLSMLTFMVGGLVLAGCHQGATLFTVDTTVDSVDVNAGDGLCADSGGLCSLRAAVMEANALPGVEEIRLAPGATYVLTIAGAGEDLAATGDLDITAGVVITGEATIDGNGLDRVIDTRHAGGLVELDGPDLTGGSAVDGAGLRTATNGVVSVLASNIYANSGGDAVQHNAGTLYLWSSTVHDNSGIGATADGGTLNLQNTTLSGNGGAGLAISGGTALVKYSTITDNDDGILVLSGTASLTGSIVADQATGDDCSGAVTSTGANIESGTSCALGATGDLQNATVALGALADNGGNVLTHLPGPASPAVDHGAASGCTIYGLDARDLPRPAGASCDAGAVETQPTTGVDCEPLNLGPGADLKYCDLSGLALNFQNLSGADLTGANLSGAALLLANLDGATLDGATLDGANLTDASAASITANGTTFAGTTVTRIDVTGADLSGALLTGITGIGVTTVPTALPPGWVIGGGIFLGAGVDASGANLTNSDLSNGNFEGTNFTNAVLTGATIAGANLSGATLDGVLTGSLIGIPTTLPPDFTVTLGWFVGPSANLTGADLTGADLRNRDLTSTIFDSATLDSALLDGADLSHARMIDTSLNLTDFVGATMWRLRSDGVLGGPILPSGWIRERRILWGPGADLSGISRNSFTTVDGATLTDLDATGAHFWFLQISNSDLTGASFSSVDASSISLVDSDLTNANFDSSSALYLDVLRVDMTDAAFTNADLGHISADVVDSVLEGTDFTGSTMRSLRGWANTGTPISVPATHTHAKGLIFAPDDHFPDADVSGLDLADIDVGADWLSPNAVGTDFSGSNVNRLREGDATNADFSSARLTDLRMMEIGGADFTNADFRDLMSHSNTGVPAALPSLWTYESGAFFGPWAELVGGFTSFTGKSLVAGDWTQISAADLDFSDSVIANTDLRGADLANGDFTRANLLGSSIDQTDFSGAIWSNTTCPDGTNTDTNGGTCVGHDPTNIWEITTDPFGTPTALAGESVTLGDTLLRPSLSYVAGATIVEGPSDGVDWYIDDVLYRDNDFNAPFDFGGGSTLPTGVIFNGTGGGAGNSFFLDVGIHTIRAEASTTAGPLTFTATFRVDE